ncbi:MAG: PKD repeat protein [Halioglobus sp.]|jgi:PKD repeat protein
MYSPDFFPDQYDAYEELSELLTSGVAGLGYGLSNNGDERIQSSSNLLFPLAPNVKFNLSFDLAAMSTDTDNKKLIDIRWGELWVFTGTNNSLTIIPLDNSYNIKTGWTTLCLDLVPGSKFLNFKAESGSVLDGFNMILLDNISVNCEIENANLDITGWKIGSLRHDFDLVEDDPNLYTSNISSIEWDFGDGITSSELNPKHTYAVSGIYTVTAFIKDEFGCCTTLSKEIDATEGCGTVTLSGTNSVSDLLSILELNDLIDLRTAVATVEVDGVLEIDVDGISFGEDLNFLLTPGSNIVVNSNNLLSKNGGFIGPCGADFGGVIVNDGAHLLIRDVTIWGAETAIKLNENSVLTSVDCIIEDSGYGIFIDGQGTIPTFTGNTIRNCDFGINAENAYELNITAQNHFISCGMGIRYFKTGGMIWNGIFQDCNFGIFLHYSPIPSLIRQNYINAKKTGIALIKHYQNVLIEQNNIGAGDVAPLYGIYIENGATRIENNAAINASYRAIAAYNPVYLTVWENEYINVNSEHWNGEGAHGIYVFNHDGGTIQSNAIRGHMRTNIYCISCDGIRIADQFLTGATGHGIVMEGGSGSRIGGSKILTEPRKGIGLYSHNGSEILFNQIRADNTGLFVNNLSQTHDIGCNHFLDGNRDIVTRAVLGPQYHTNNVFRTVGSLALTEDLLQDEVFQSRFTVDDCPTVGAISQCDHPEQWEAPGFFRIEAQDPDFPSSFPTGCDNNPTGDPTNLEPGDEYWCWLFSQFESTQNLNSLKSWVLRYKALKLNSLKPERMIPEECIPYNDFYCDMDEFIDIENSVKDLRKDVGSGKLSYEMMEAGIENRIADLDVLDCNNYILRLYRNIYRTLLKDMIEEELRSDEVEELRDAAELCAHMYGDVVYWARGILDHRGESTTYDDVTCESEWSEDPKSRNKSDYANDEILVSPNPAGNYMILENKTGFEVLQVKLTDSFGRVHVVSENLEGQLKIDCSTYSSGIYFITITHSSGYHTVKRVVVTN